MEQNTSHDIFTDPALVRAKQEDPFFKFISQHWRNLLVAAVVVLGGYYVVTRLQTTQYESQVSASDLFGKAQESFTEVVTLEERLRAFPAVPTDPKADPKVVETQAKERADLELKLKEANEKLSQRVAALNDVKAPYNYLASLYNSFKAARVGDLAGVDTHSRQVGSEGNSIFAELSQLAAARVLLDDPNRRAEGVKKLLDLASASNYVSVSAAVSLARVANTSEERTQAIRVIDTIITQSPEQTDLLKEDLAQLRGDSSD